MPRPLACVVVNPAKRSVTPQVLERVERKLTGAGYRTHLLETSLAEPGPTQARLAVASGAQLVVAVGGDGTVRAVAAALAGTGIEMGVLPLGTANLAARNLGLPVRDLDALIHAAAHGEARPADLAWVSSGAPDPEALAAVRTPPGGWARPTLGAEHACIIVTGIGFDAGLVASTRPRLKARIKWGAYAVAAMANLWSPRLGMTLDLTGTDGERTTELLTARTLLLANGGRLPGGITLMRSATMDDGVMDLAAIDTVAGLAGWTSLARQVLPPFAATYSRPERSLGRVRLRRGVEARVRLDTPAMVEVDGDLLPPTRDVRVRLDAGALLVRRPA
ncbi:diacylglycerol/lipid kinase family protein [Actinomyces haliotis]|uniref:diacylglycerol/lipid kinase family protein n=1 Tax=Actinomyces haliotis TaxID=1280843 RepID=UPI00188EE66E|nr:diacylglycerol kinase family protein [Actinomyces haliotis]